MAENLEALAVLWCRLCGDEHACPADEIEDVIATHDCADCGGRLEDGGGNTPIVTVSDRADGMKRQCGVAVWDGYVLGDDGEWYYIEHRPEQPAGAAA